MGGDAQDPDLLRRELDQRLGAAYDKIADQKDLFTQRMADADKAIQSALVSAEKAVTKAEFAAEKRFEAVNEFRQTLSDQTATFIPRIEYDAAHQTLIDRISAVADRMGTLELRLTSRLDVSQGTSAGGRSERTERRLDVGQVIAIIAVLIAAISVAAFILKK